jgi:hypothetical protein
MKLTIQSISESFRAQVKGAPAQSENERIPEPSVILQSSGFVFDEWYRSKYAVPSSMSSVAHFLAVGSTKGFDPNPLFRSKWYITNYNLTKDQAAVAALHYLLIGSKGGMRPNPFFDPNWYRTTYPEVQAANMEPVVHYFFYGAKEGRHPAPGIYTQWLPHGLDLATGAQQNPLVIFMELLDLLSSSKTD